MVPEAGVFSILTPARPHYTLLICYSITSVPCLILRVISMYFIRFMIHLSILNARSYHQFVLVAVR